MTEGSTDDFTTVYGGTGYLNRHPSYGHGTATLKGYRCPACSAVMWPRLTADQRGQCRNCGWTGPKVESQR